MNSGRRGVLALLGGLVLARPSLSAASSKPAAVAASRSSYKPRHILCFLGPENGLEALRKSARAAIDDFAPDFSLDDDYSQDEPDDRMNRSFNVCWDRVDPEAHQLADEEAVAGHGSVLYVLGPSMDAETAVKTSENALRFVQHMLDNGAIAVKGESAGIAHGARRWKQLFEQSRSEAAADDGMALARTCRLAFARRPIGGDADEMMSVGFHLIGLPDVQVHFTKNGDQPSTNTEQLKIAALIDDIADQMARDGVEAAVKDRRAALADDTRYEEDEYKFNPFGVVSINDVKL
ncbi:hypothetical protein FY134_20640 [Agrobacterium fabrum]|jgi:hypothetical protein|uniref:hypothetical protein n=1 Tax=Agrobacterium fabrum TaxID=1176649 RepID=UPI000889CD63|nr:hypothetical protein [Agrobacterium fabrum]AYM60104.1 hypothetical protein At1D132_40970 [Agrobacterium fabrum]NSZ14171.1 hypothetical protein [Agrobacterium fabrum]NTB10001.1 hypothetical protein [Agrobacterium fabrum]UXT60069.1 hypothetical protein FY134_20640 [Agrobacterium fabrum]CUX38677.1 conserved exported hypothetical protein [Agrobacterium fabrum str. J-07]